jgi:hypothetical protein
MNVLRDHSNPIGIEFKRRTGNSEDGIGGIVGDEEEGHIQTW